MIISMPAFIYPTFKRLARGRVVAANYWPGRRMVTVQVERRR